jgi:hypothetical protein
MTRTPATFFLAVMALTFAGCVKMQPAPERPFSRRHPSNSEPIESRPAMQELQSMYRAAGIQIPPPVALAELPWGQLAGFKIEASRAEEEWKRLRAATDATGHYPLIVVDNHGFLTDLPANGGKSMPQEVLDAAALMKPSEWFATHEEDLKSSDDYEIPRDEWPDSSPHTELLGLRDHREKWYADVYIVLLPTREPWMACAFIGWGGWNACPNPEEHTALLRYWHQKYGAEPMLLSLDVLEARVSKPPTTRDAAMVLAREHFLYCGDIVEQGVGSLDALGATLLNGRFWFFWWD